MLRSLAVATRLLRARRPSSRSLHAQTKRLHDNPSSSHDATARFVRYSVPIRLLSSTAAAEEWASEETEMMEKCHEDLLTVAQLKDLCRERGLFVSGRKADLQERLKEYFLEKKRLFGGYRGILSGEEVRVVCSLWGLDNRGTWEELFDRLESLDRLREHSEDTAPDSKLDSDEKTEWASDKTETVEKSHEDLLTVTHLKDLCRERGLFVSGRKADLQERLQEYILSVKGVFGGYRGMSSEDVRVACSLSGLDNRGTWEELFDRLESLDHLREHSEDKARDSKLDSDEKTDLETQGEETDSQRASDETEMMEKSHEGLLAVTQLKDLCKERGLIVSGGKADLQERLKEYILEKKSLFGGYKGMSGDDVLAACSLWGLDNKGTWKELVLRLQLRDRLREHSEDKARDSKLDSDDETALEKQGEERELHKDDFDEMTVAQLKAICRQRALKVSGTKVELLERLREPAISEQNSDPTDEKMTAPDQEELFCFDRANLHRLVPRIWLERNGRSDDILLSPPLDTADETESLLALLPNDLAEGLADPADRAHLMEVVLDVGRRPFAWVGGRRLMLGTPDRTLCPLELHDILTGIGPFGTDNRAGLDGSLHRISAVRNRDGKAVGLTLRVGRHVPGNAIMIADLLHGTEASILFVGEPGSGKTSIIRDAARLLAAEKSVIIVDTSCEIGGAGDIPHECIGLSRRMQVKSVDVQAHVMVECVQNHTPAVMVIDEIGRAAEVQAALTCKERGVRIIASAHGDMPGLVRNSQLCDLVGGVDVVTVGDKTARQDAKRNGKESGSKLRAERRGPPIFDVIVELKRGRLHEWRVVLCSASAVDSILAKDRYGAQIRRREESGSCIRLQSVEHDTGDKTRERMSNSALANWDKFREEASNGVLMTKAKTTNAEKTTNVMLDANSTNCPSCNKNFRRRLDMIQHALAKRACVKKISGEIINQFIQERDRLRGNKQYDGAGCTSDFDEYDAHWEEEYDDLWLNEDKP